MFSVDLKNTELKTIEMRKKTDEQKALDARCKEMYKMCRKAERMSLIRDRQLKALDEEARTNALKAKEERERKFEALEREQNLARAVDDLKRREIVEIKNKQLLRNNCHELQRVEKQLRTAYAQKELVCQIKEKEAARKEGKVREYYDDVKMIERGKHFAEKEEERRAGEKELKSEYKTRIEEQIREANERRRRETVTSHHGCSIVFEPTENARKPKQRLNTNGGEKRPEELEKIRKESSMERERDEAEKMDKRIKEYLLDVEKRTKHQEELKNKKNEQKERIYKCLVDNLTSLTTSTAKIDEIRIAIVQKQQQNAVWRGEKQREELKKLRQDEMLKHNEMQLKLKEDWRKNEKEKDLAEMKKYLQSVQEQNEISERKDRQRRQMMIEYGKDLKKSIELRNDLRIERKMMEKNESAEAANLKQLRLAEIENEKTIYVKPHLETLKGFFPPTKNYCSRNDNQL